MICRFINIIRAVINLIFASAPLRLLSFYSIDPSSSFGETVTLAFAFCLLLSHALLDVLLSIGGVAPPP